MGEGILMTKYFKLENKQSHRLQAYNPKKENNVL